MVEFEINVSLALGFGGSFTEVLVLAHMSQVEFFLVGLVGSFWEHTFLFKSGQDSEWFFDQLNTSGKIPRKYLPFCTLPVQGRTYGG